MRGLRVLRDRLRAWLRRETVAGEIREELEHHRRELADRLRASGLAPEDADREAARRLGNQAVLQDAGYDVRGGGRLETVMQDLRYSLRLLRRNPGFATVAVLTLALGIGANTAIFSVANGILLRPLPYPDAGQLAMIWMDNIRIQLAEDWHSYPNYVDYRDQSTTFAEMAVFNRTARNLTGLGDPERVIGAYNSASLFDVLGVRPVLGRVFTSDEDQPGADDVVVISHGFWQRRFGGDGDVLGRTIELSGRTRRIVGVMPASFTFPAADVEYWLPAAPSEANRNSRGALWLQMVGRLKPGVTVPQAQADLERVNAGILEAFPNQRGYGINVVGYRDQVVGAVRPAVLVLIGAVAFVLLIACTNVANLLLSRSSARERELALRAAIGAGRGRIIRQLLTESVVLAVVGGAAGLGLARLGLDALLAVAPDDLPRADAIALDGRVLLFTAGLSILTGVLFGLMPALQTARTDPGQTLKEGGRGASGLGRSLRRALVVAEVALAVVLLVGAGLMLRSFVRLQQVDLGFRTSNVLSARVTLSGERYREGPAVVDFFERVLARTAASPGVEGAAAIGTVFLSATPNSTNFSIEGRPDFAPEERVEVPVDSITPDYFRVMGVPLLRGRFFDQRDADAGPASVIINNTMARRFWPDEDPVGRRIKYGRLESQAPWMTIVGVVADTRRTGYDAAVRPETYLPHAQSTTSSMTLVVRTAGEPESAAPALRAAVRDLDPAVPLYGVSSLDDQLAGMTAQRRLNTLLLSIFGGVAAALAAVGIYGVIAYSVAQRTRELGVRMALGASRGSIVGLVLREGLSLAALGLVLGLAGALALSRAMTTLLYDVSATDPATFAAIAGVTASVAALACALPALRAISIDAHAALRAE